MNNFEDLLKINNYDLQKIINQISDNNLIAIALKSTTEGFKNNFYQAISKSRKVMVEDILNSIVVTHSEIEKAQKEIVNIAKKLGY